MLIHCQKKKNEEATSVKRTSEKEEPDQCWPSVDEDGLSDGEVLKLWSVELSAITPMRRSLPNIGWIDQIRVYLSMARTGRHWQDAAAKMMRSSSLNKPDTIALIKTKPPP